VDAPVGVTYAALRGRCPACGRGKLFSGIITIAKTCSHCGLDLSAHEQGDGPAFLGILLIGFLTATGAVLLDIYQQPPFWVHAAIWIPFVFIGSLLTLRWGKGALVAIQYNLRRDDFSQP
jgi:uncharacterized protein (DUF983 family)